MERRISIDDESAESGLRYGRPKAVGIITYSDRLSDPFVSSDQCVMRLLLSEISENDAIDHIHHAHQTPSGI